MSRTQFKNAGSVRLCLVRISYIGLVTKSRPNILSLPPMYCLDVRLVLINWIIILTTFWLAIITRQFDSMRYCFTLHNWGLRISHTAAICQTSPFTRIFLDYCFNIDSQTGFYQNINNLTRLKTEVQPHIKTRTCPVVFTLTVTFPITHLQPHQPQCCRFSND